MVQEKGFCYKLADFDLKAAKVLQDLQSQAEFCDINLGCSDSDGQMLRGHQAILASFSTVFKDMFLQMGEGSGRNNSTLFLRGVAHQDLSSILDFIYQGEAVVIKEQMESFLATAQDLNIFGLTANNPHENSRKTRSSNTVPTIIPKPSKHKSSSKPSKSRDHGSNEDDNYLSSISSKLDQLESFDQLESSYDNNAYDNNAYDNNDVYEDMNNNSYDNKDDTEMDYNNNSQNYDSYDVKHEAALDALEDFQETHKPRYPDEFEDQLKATGTKDKNGKKYYFAKCKLCGKEGRRDKVKQHVKQFHSSEYGGAIAEDPSDPTKPIRKIVTTKSVAVPEDFQKDNIEYFDHEAHWDPTWSMLMASNPLLPHQWIEIKAKSWLEYLPNHDDPALSRLRCRICYHYGNEDGNQGPLRGVKIACPISTEEGAPLKDNVELNRKMMFRHINENTVHKTTVENLDQKRRERRGEPLENLANAY